MRLIALPLAGALCTAAVSAWAEPSDTDRATARALAREGYEAQKHEQYALAADRYQRADALVHAPTLLLGLARAQAGMGHVVEASETYRQILREPLDARAPQVFVKAVEDAKRESEQVEQRRAWVTVAVQGPDASSIQLDDAPIGASEVGVPVACNPGSHSVTATATGFEPATRRFSVTEGSRQTVTLSLKAVPAEPPPAPVARPEVVEPAPPAEHRSGAWMGAEVGAFAIGAAGLAVGGAAGIYTLVRHHSLAEECPDGRCAPGSGDALATYHTIATVSTIATIVGAAGLATGITLALTAPRNGSVEAYAGPLGGGITGRF